MTMLLFDENIAARGVEIIAAEFPGAIHVRDVGLAQSSDENIWSWAKENGYAIVSKDDDFLTRALVRGHPPKTVILKVGNLRTRDLISFLLRRQSVITEFLEVSQDAALILSL